jgi:NAD-dependent dihydropyrimidine dehydrogenase PreA subunit
MGDLVYLKDVTTLKLHPDKCIGCGFCEIVCPHRVFEMREGRASIIDRDLCMECGACARNCPADAIEVSAGVGCAAGVIQGALRGTEPTCDCGGGETEGPGTPCC